MQPQTEPTAMHGDFVSCDLLTADPTAALDFYATVTGSAPAGRVTKDPTSRWRARVLVDDLDLTVARTRQLGGTAAAPTTEPGVGRTSVLADPAGLEICAFEASTPVPARDASTVGALAWRELVTRDHEAAFLFYAALFGWQKLRDVPMGPVGNYLIYGRDGNELGGMFTRPRSAPLEATWLYYFEVADLDAAAARATQHQAHVIAGPMPVPDGKMVQLRDPQGAVFALHQKVISLSRTSV